MPDEILAELNSRIQAVWKSFPDEATEMHEAFTQLILFLDNHLEVQE